MVFLLGFQSKGQGNLFIAVDLYDGRRSPSSCRDNLIYNTVSMWSTRSLSATRSADTFVASLMTSFQSLSPSGNSDTSARDRICACTVRPWVATRR
jgi:hypothetical protein